MAWFATADASGEMDGKIERATSEAIPNGELDMAVALEITDDIRSKKVPPKSAMRCLKKRLAMVYSNPNLLLSALKLCDMCVKNGGSAFIEELNSKEFVDYLVEFIFKVHYDTKKYQVYSLEAKFAVGVQILRIVSEWNLYFEKSLNNYLLRVYQNLQRQGYEFPAVDAGVAQNAANFVDSITPPDWVDGKDCMICYNPFSVMNRKHHCRACGGVFCQEHSSKELPLPSLGIVQAVRVCDDCYLIHKPKEGIERGGDRAMERGIGNERNSGSSEEEQLKKAIELSLQDVPKVGEVKYGAEFSAPAHAPPDDDMDEDMKAAIAASLADVKKEPELEFYLSALSFDTNAYQSLSQPSGHYFGQQAQSQSGPSQMGQSQFGLNQLASQVQIQSGTQHAPGNEQFGTTGTTGQYGGAPERTDLTPQEEDDITLFVQLINGVKNDPARQANILNDQNLSELYSRVVRLRPRLNRSLRDSIEKYDFFLEMNNKINTVTRLYDQFLENKLSQAYGRHSVQDSYNWYGQKPTIHQNMTGQNTGQIQSGHNTGQSTTPQQGQISEQVTQSQITGQMTQSHITGHRTTGQEISSQTQASGVNSHSNFTGNYASGVFPPPPENDLLPTVATGTPYPVENRYSKEFYKGESGNSEVQVSKFGDAIQHTGPENTASGRARKSSYPTSYPENYPEAKDFAGAFPQVPSSPPMGSDVSDADSVASRYPALDDKFEAEPEEVHHNHASERFPSVTEIEKDAQRKSEPEPLIEL